MIAKDFDIPEIVRQAKPAVVQIVALDDQNKTLKSGTGFFISADGNLLTNYHVISDARSILAKTPSGAVYSFKKNWGIFAKAGCGFAHFLRDGRPLSELRSYNSAEP